MTFSAEKEQLPLEEALALFEEGVALSVAAIVFSASSSESDLLASEEEREERIRLSLGST